jgi:hypothetical protein
MLLAVLTGLAGSSCVRAGVVVPPWLPRYDLTLDCDLEHHVIRGQMKATWTNMCSRPTEELVFNAHSHFVLPDKDVGLTAKTLEILRVTPSEALGVKQPSLEVEGVYLVVPAGPDALPQMSALRFRFDGDTKTALVVNLPFAVEGGKSVTVVLDFVFKLPPKQGRWGQFNDVTFLSNWLPVFAVYGEQPPPPRKPKEGDPEPPPPPSWDTCWQPTPFVPWHLPWFNEAGHYHAVVRLPANQVVACTGQIIQERCLLGCRKELEIDAPAVRDWAFLCSARYCEYRSEVVVDPDRPPVQIHICALKEHEHYAREMLRYTADALAAYSQWISPYPYPQFTVAESFFGWNGNQQGGLIMVDARIFGMPHLAGNFVELLVSHEICHQWWYNVVGVNGYCETWMDEAMAVHLTHRLLNQKCGRNNALMQFPVALRWLPNIYREDYAIYTMLGAFGRGENSACVQEMQDFGHVVNLFAMTYDKGSRVVGMIEERLGDPGFLDFLKVVYKKYQFRILRVADFQRELELFTGQSWEHFFQDWLYGKGLGDWAVDRVDVQPPAKAARMKWDWWHKIPASSQPPVEEQGDRTRVVVVLRQKEECTEQTTLGFAMPGEAGYPIRVPIIPQAGSYTLAEPPGKFESLPDGSFRVEVLLPCEPEQIAVDPDQILVDRDPVNNYWKTPIRWRFTPLYTFLEETDLTNAHDRWNVIAGPWFYEAGYDDVWYTRATTIGVRAGAYRTQAYSGGLYAAYRTDFRDIVVGVDGQFEHLGVPSLETGYNFEQRLMTVYQGDNLARRGVLWGRWIFQYGDSLYLPPMHYLEGFSMYQDNFLPFPNSQLPNSERYHNMTTMGLHYRINYLTPYWDPEGGFQFDAFYQGGMADMETTRGMQMGWLQFSYLQDMPDMGEWVAGAPRLNTLFGPMLRWLSDTRLALRAFGGMSFPTRGQFFTMGSSTLFRGFDMAERQGSAVWVGSAEWRVPLLTGLNWDCCDHCVGLRNVYGALFYDVGNAYQNNQQVGPIAHDVGGGLRLDVTWFSLVERTILRFDAAKAVNSSSSWQFWFGLNQPF